MATTQSLRFRRPETKDPVVKVAKPDRHSGLLQDQIRRAARPPWSPSFNTALRILLIVRVTSAMFSNIDDCDEVFNFWEPLHFFHRGYGFQTWEVTPQYGIRSWAYILFHLPIAKIGTFLSQDSKRPAFFGVRILLAGLSSLAEVNLYRNVYEKVNERVGRYLFFMLLFNTGMWNASSALLPSSFAMYASTFAFAASIAPAKLGSDKRTLAATLSFATGAILGWPFALALALPFVIEELFVFGADIVPAATRPSWILARWQRLFGCGVLAALIFIPVIGVDSIAYGKLSVVPWNIVSYNIFPGTSDRGPNLYGTSPSSFYFLNLLLNFNILVPFALLSLPALAVTYVYDRKRLGFMKSSPEQSSPFTILGLKLAPFYLWLAILTIQEHKEERFMFPAYTMLCFNAAVTVYLVRGWMETVFVTLTKSPYRASRSSIFSTFTTSVLVLTTVLSISRIFANWHYYHAPLTIAYTFESDELPLLLNSTNLLPVPLLPPGVVPRHGKERQERIDLSPIRQFNLTLCVGKEWHRFPGHYLIPDGVKVEFIKSEFDGMLPGHFAESSSVANSSSNDSVLAKWTTWWPRPETRLIPEGLNDRNKEEPSHYVPVSQCAYLIDLDFPQHPSSSALEPRYAVDTETWERVTCLPFLDARHSPLLSRILWIPGSKWRGLNEWGDYCLLKNKRLVESRVEQVMKSTKLLL